MAYHQSKLDTYRQLIHEGKPFRSTTCPYCNGQRDPTVKHVHPSTKPANPWDFWHDVLIRKYAAVQSGTVKAHRQLAEETDPPCMLVVGPMVDQSELPFRMLCRQYGATLAYTPMLHAKSFAAGASYRSQHLTTSPPDAVKAAMEAAPLESTAATTLSSENARDSCGRDRDDESDFSIESHLVDRPCIVQFCGHDADTVWQAARFAVLGERAAAFESSAQPTDGASAAATSATTTTSYPVRVRVNDREATCTAAEDAYHLLYQCDAVDLNLGCPQGIARRGHYGAFLMEDWELVHTMVHTLHVELEVPVTVKIRVFDHPGQHCSSPAAPTSGSSGVAAVHSTGDNIPVARQKEDYDEALTILYARMIRDAGAQVLCIHGRTREMKGQLTGEANLPLIRRVRSALNHTIPVISNGNVRSFEDVVACLRETHCEGHMCAEPLLWDPKLFSNPSHPVMPGRTHGADKETRLSALHTALVYLGWVRRCPVDIGFVKAHLFKMCYHSYELHTAFRDELGRLSTKAAAQREGIGRVEQQQPRNEELRAPDGPAGFGEEERTSADGEESPAPAWDAAADNDAGASAVTLSPSAFERYVDTLGVHLRALLAAENACALHGAQPKAAQEAKAQAREDKIDVWDGEEGLGITFF